MRIFWDKLIKIFNIIMGDYTLCIEDNIKILGEVAFEKGIFCRMLSRNCRKKFY